MLNPLHRKIVPLVLVLFFFSSTTHGLTLEDISKAVKEGDIDLNFRYRYEFVEQDGAEKDAGSSTLKSRITFKSSTIDGISFGVEADNVSVIGSERYNSTDNGETQYPVVADPEGFDLNQAYINFKNDALNVTGGRQRILLDDQRFVGGVGWRQNEQTYDALRAQISPSTSISAQYAYVWNVNRIFGPEDGAQPSDWRGSSHFLNVDFAVTEQHKLRGFAYLLDFDNDNGVPNSTETFGVAYSGTFGKFKLSAAVARQSDYGDSPLDFDANYYSVATSFALDPVTLTAGYEVLGSDDGTAAFRTPLATLHKFQGWADKFLGTPNDGIKDLYFGVSGKLGPIKLAATWHDFKSDENGSDYGSELDLVATYPVTRKTLVQLKYANYRADDFSTDTTKVWLTLAVKF